MNVKVRVLFFLGFFVFFSSGKESIFSLSPEVFQISWSAFQTEPGGEIIEILKHCLGCTDLVVSTAPYFKCPLDCKIQLKLYSSQQY